MWRADWRCWLLLVLLGSSARAQNLFVGSGSTPQGDYLRGVGVAAWGEGLYNLNTAMGYSITVDANIKLDTYLGMVFRAERDNYQKLNKQRMENTIKAYETYKERIREHPERYDVFTGNALNAAFEEMNDPSIQPSSLRGSPVPIPREMIRRIPFKLDQKNMVFSLQRLTARGKGKWPVAFQQDIYAGDLKTYEKAMDKALDQMIDGKIDNATIAEYQAAVNSLLNKLEHEYEGRFGDRRFHEAMVRIREMQAVIELMKAQKAQAIMAGLDRYDGKTVDDLRKFMIEHHLKFSAVNDESADERNLYIELYAAIDEMRKTVVVGAPKGKDR